MPRFIDDKAPTAASDCCVVARALNRRCYTHTGNSGFIWCLGYSLSSSVGFPTQDETMDAARSAPLDAHYHGNVIYLLL